jgi:hypothetical protein
MWHALAARSGGGVVLLHKMEDQAFSLIRVPEKRCVRWSMKRLKTARFVEYARKPGFRLRIVLCVRESGASNSLICMYTGYTQ